MLGTLHVNKDIYDISACNSKPQILSSITLSSVQVSVYLLYIQVLRINEGFLAPKYFHQCFSAGPKIRVIISTVEDL